MRHWIRFALLALLLLTPRLAAADDVADAIAEAGRAYKAGDLAGTRAALGEASQFLAQRAAAGLGAALPSALPGWTAEDVETNTSGLAMIGGGSQATREYKNAEGQHVQIQVTADSPLVAPLAMAMSNPAMAGAMGKLLRFGSQRAIQTNDNEIQLLVGNRILISVTGDAPIEAKLAYAKAIDVGKLSAQ
ncbi:MAG TPA: hypothetical protein VL154_08600 [Acetobacteraceae bacterium]|nr:hypothetical protein [Acetobacteraceae bacterium]